MKPSTLSLLTLALLGTQANSLHAETLQYGVDFTIGYYSFSPAFDPQMAVGDVFTGTFTIDSSVLATDGINQAAEFQSFTVTMANTTWTMGDPNSEFSGFRGPTGMNLTGPGIDIVGGQITNLRGGVFGSFDTPFIDFSTDASAPFQSEAGCTGLYCGNKANAFSSVVFGGNFGGTMSIHAISAPVPEPETWGMALFGAGILGAALRRRREGA